jgi:hypothetical protein
VDLEVALLDGWVRFWYKGEQLPLPADLQRSLIETQQRADAEARRADAEARRADELERQLAALRRQLEEERKGRRKAD